MDGAAAERAAGSAEPAAGSAGSAAPWVKRFVATPDRAREAAEVYARLGHEVRLEPAAGEDLPDGCDGCALALGLFQTVYTRSLT